MPALRFHPVVPRLASGPAPTDPDGAVFRALHDTSSAPAPAAGRPA